MGNIRPSNKDAHDPLLKYGTKRKRNPKNLWKCCVVTAAVIVILLCLLFLIVFVGLPLAFKYSAELQRNLIFPTCDLWPPDPEFTNFKKYDVEGVRNLYVTVNEDDNITLGVWHILPYALVNDSIYDNYNYSDALANSEYPVVLHFHGNGGNRIADLEMYNVLRMFFHIIAFDYRGYADSTAVKPSEEGIVQDSIQLYKWLREQTDAKIYFWGHSLGSALSTHTAARLRSEDIVPMGLFLEAPFTTLKEEIQAIPLTKVFSWLPWYESTMLDPLDEHGFYFRTSDNILMVDCPIMIVHAEDDSNIPSYLGEKLYNIAREKRDPVTQGNVTFHLLPEHLQCNHIQIYNAPDLPNYIR
ncbi:hypothetical protein ILUMI_10169 [Ignelater luminosus]|uniref:AB hydrolase-1 domain-containing protein n=1 Tax=Ignelater luminosus TaxID=2038154 RepID=A0A8K0D4E7_IGNLU|nr:hypothetical protein ILUMI_10169 [Ignelater luminosus]